MIDATVKRKFRTNILINQVGYFISGAALLVAFSSPGMRWIQHKIAHHEELKVYGTAKALLFNPIYPLFCFFLIMIYRIRKRLILCICEKEHSFEISTLRGVRLLEKSSTVAIIHDSDYTADSFFQRGLYPAWGKGKLDMFQINVNGKKTFYLTPILFEDSQQAYSFLNTISTERVPLIEPAQ